MLVTVMFSLMPGRPGRRQQMPRTCKRTRTPAMEARYRARMMPASTSWLHLKMISPLP